MQISGVQCYVRQLLVIGSIPGGTIDSIDSEQLRNPSRCSQAVLSCYFRLMRCCVVSKTHIGRKMHWLKFVRRNGSEPIDPRCTSVSMEQTSEFHELSMAMCGNAIMSRMQDFNVHVLTLRHHEAAFFEDDRSNLRCSAH